MIGYPRHFLSVLWTVLIALTVTGLVLVPGALELRWEMHVPLHLPAGWRIGVAALHALCAFSILALMGSLYSLHMRMGWRHSQNVRTGIATLSVLGALALTGLGIYYLADEDLSRWTSGLHIALSLFGVAAMLLHYVFGRRIRIARLARRHQHAESGGLSRIADRQPMPGVHEPPRVARPRAQARGG